jgi:non-heme chloroperoxidase
MSISVITFVGASAAVAPRVICQTSNIAQRTPRGIVSPRTQRRPEEYGNMKILKRIGTGLVVLILLVAVGLPLLYAVVPYEWPDLPPAGRRLPVGNELFVNAIDRGAGPAVVLVHGLPGLGSDWEPLIDALVSRGRRVIAYDRIGYGRSDGRPSTDVGEFTVEANSRELITLIENEGLEDVTVVGWSYGGPISIEAALDADGAARIGRLVLVGTGGPDSDDSEPPPSPGLIATGILRWVGLVPPAGAAMQRAASTQAFSEQDQPDWWLLNLSANFAAANTRVSWVAEGSAIGASGEFRPDLLTQPTLLIHGDDDRLAPLAIGEYVHSKIPGSRLEIVEDGSHMLPVTHAEHLAGLIVSF